MLYKNLKKKKEKERKKEEKLLQCISVLVFSIIRSMFEQVRSTDTWMNERRKTERRETGRLLLSVPRMLTCWQGSEWHGSKKPLFNKTYSTPPLTRVGPLSLPAISCHSCVGHNHYQLHHHCINHCWHLYQHRLQVFTIGTKSIFFKMEKEKWKKEWENYQRLKNIKWLYCIHILPTFLFYKIRISWNNLGIVLPMNSINPATLPIYLVTC